MTTSSVTRRLLSLTAVSKTPSGGSFPFSFLLLRSCPWSFLPVSPAGLGCFAVRRVCPLWQLEPDCPSPCYPPKPGSVRQLGRGALLLCPVLPEAAGPVLTFGNQRYARLLLRRDGIECEKPARPNWPMTECLIAVLLLCRGVGVFGVPVYCCRFHQLPLVSQQQGD